jgi:hypothetical protein
MARSEPASKEGCDQIFFACSSLPQGLPYTGGSTSWSSEHVPHTPMGCYLPMFNHIGTWHSLLQVLGRKQSASPFCSGYHTSMSRYHSSSNSILNTDNAGTPKLPGDPSPCACPLAPYCYACSRPALPLSPARHPCTLNPLSHL